MGLWRPSFSMTRKAFINEGFWTLTFGKYVYIVLISFITS